ncbi:hypothetical protein B0H19DRAFT_1083347 [Mycena capillaripes]|nr:hypothetical protein B0H19DRAFT_1083347 [Mycena capillaripes]
MPLTTIWIRPVPAVLGTPAGLLLNNSNDDLRKQSPVADIGVAFRLYSLEYLVTFTVHPTVATMVLVGGLYDFWVHCPSYLVNHWAHQVSSPQSESELCIPTFLKNPQNNIDTWEDEGVHIPIVYGGRRTLCVRGVGTQWLSWTKWSRLSWDRI